VPFFLLALDLTRLATGRLMWWSGIQLSSYDLPADSEPERASAGSMGFWTGFLTVRGRLAWGKSASIQVL
jgi:hypothetical protein